MPAQKSAGVTVSLVNMDLRLMPYTLDDEDEALAAHELMMADGCPGFLRFLEDTYLG